MDTNVIHEPHSINIIDAYGLPNILWFILKATLLFSIVAINTPFVLMYNLSTLLCWKLVSLFDSSANASWRWGDPRLSVGIEFQTIVSNFFKVVAGELLLVLSTGVITFYTAPLLVFYISMAVGLTAILLKWLNTSSVSKTAFSCLCDGFGLNPMMFWFSFIGLFDIGCHPVAKRSFVAKKAFLFTNDNPTRFEEEVTNSESRSIELPWRSFEQRGLFKLCPRIDFINRNDRKYILKSFMVLKLFGRNNCEYPVERLELPEDYTKFIELLNFLIPLSSADSFVTDKMRGRYEHSLTLLEIVDGVGQNEGYRTVDPLEEVFVVAGCILYQHLKPTEEASEHGSNY